MPVDAAALLAQLGYNPSGNQTDPVLRTLIGELDGTPGGADMAAYRTAVDQDVIDAGLDARVDALEAAQPSVAVVAINSAVLADGATETGTVAIAKTALLQLVAASEPCWLRLYTTAAARAADAGRAIGDLPTAGTGVLSQVAPGLDGAGLTVPITPAHELHNGDSPRTSTIYYALTNSSGAAAALVVTLTALAVQK